MSSIVAGALMPRPHGWVPRIGRLVGPGRIRGRAAVGRGVGCRLDRHASIGAGRLGRGRRGSRRRRRRSPGSRAPRTTSPPRSSIASTASGVAVPASSTVSVRCRGPSWRTWRTNGRSARAMPSTRRRGLDLDDVAARRLAAQLGRCREGDEPAARDERDLVARLGLVEVLGRDQQRPALVAQAMELIPDPAAQERIDARRRLVEEQQRRIVDERAGQLEPSLHPARQPAGAPAADVPQVDQLEDLAGPPPARAPQHPEQRRDEIDVLADRQVRVQGERLGHVADPLARLASERGAVPRRGPVTVPLVGVSAPVSSADGRRLARAGWADDPEDVPAGTVSEMPSTAS